MTKSIGQREPGLVLAIAGAGGVCALARRLGLSQPSVSRWLRVPAERVVAVELASGVPREVVRPDLYRRVDLPVIERVHMANGHVAQAAAKP